MPCNDKMGNGVRGFPACMGWYGGRGGREFLYPRICLLQGYWFLIGLTTFYYCLLFTVSAGNCGARTAHISPSVASLNFVTSGVILRVTYILFGCK